MEIKTDAIVLQSIDYKDNDKLLTLFSPTLGKITAGIRGVKKPKAKLAFSAQPFCFAEYVLAEKGGRYTVTGAYLHESFFSLRYDIVRFYAACAATEVCLTILMENEQYEGLFIGLIECLKGLSLAEEDSAESLIGFMLIALRESGYPLDLSFLEEVDGDLGDKLWFDFRTENLRRTIGSWLGNGRAYAPITPCANAPGCTMTRTQQRGAENVPCAC